MKLQGMVVPIAMIIWLTIVVVALSYSPEQDEIEFSTIEGVIVPHDVRVYVYVVTEEGIIASVQSDTETGSFVVPELTGGVYTLRFGPISDEYAQKEIRNVHIQDGKNKNLGKLTLEADYHY